MNKIVKIIFVFAICLFESGFLDAQTITWQRTYGDNNIDYAYSIVQTPDEGYITVGQKRIQTVNYIFAMRLNKYGDTIWTRTFPGFQANQIEKTSDGNFIIICAGNLIKININGETIWTKPGSSGTKLKETTDKGFVICLSSYNGPYLFYPKLKKVDSLGNIQWEKIYTENIYDGRFSDITIDSEGNYIMTGNYSDTAYTRDYLFIMKTDSMGNIFWLKKYEAYYYSASIIVKDNDYYIGGSIGIAFLTKFNSSGNRIWLKFYDRGSEFSESYGLTNTSDGGLAFTGTYRNADYDYYVRLLKTNSDGEEQWRKLYGFGDADCAYNVRQTSDSGYILSGIRNNYQLGDIFIIKTDKTGFSNPPLLIDNNTENAPVDFTLYQNFPNPFNPSTNIKFKIIKNSFVEITIYDIQGKKVKNIVGEQKPAGEYQITFNGTNLPSGMYFYQLSINDIVRDTKKMILIN